MRVCVGRWGFDHFSSLPPGRAEGEGDQGATCPHPGPPPKLAPLVFRGGSTWSIGESFAEPDGLPPSVARGEVGGEPCDRRKRRQTFVSQPASQISTLQRRNERVIQLGDMLHDHAVDEDPPPAHPTQENALGRVIEERNIAPRRGRVTITP